MNDDLHPRVVLGIDAAWTTTEPSGVAAAVETAGGWKLAAVAASYDEFIAQSNGVQPTGKRPSGSSAVAAGLLDAARRICGARVNLVAVDMPMARHPIVGRRPSDLAVSRAYGARHAATHPPSAERPGEISDRLRESFDDAGYPLRTKDGSGRPPTQGLIEVYPHPALVEFLKAPRRLEYKAAKVLNYWPDVVLSDSGPSWPEQRRARLLEVWRRIAEALDRCVAGVAETLPAPAEDHKGWRLKAYEDKFDAVVCVAVAIACLNGTAAAFGDANSAIWAPTAGA
jgi:predicted RNase H-like nuclease